MKGSWLSATWPAADLSRALEALAQASGFGTSDVSLPAAPPNDRPTDRWLETAGQMLGVELEKTSVRYHEMKTALLNGGPALIPFEADGKKRLLLLLEARWGRMRILGPDLRPRTAPLDDIRDTLSAPLEEPLADQIDCVLDTAGVASRRRPRSRRALYEEHLGASPVCSCWIMRALPGSPFLSQLADAGQTTAAVVLMLSHLGQTTLFLVAWWMVGRGALAGDLDPAWLAAWALMLLTLVPLRMLTVSLQGRVLLGVGGLLKRRLLHGVLKLDLEAVKHQGVGMLLGRVLESNAVEALVLSGGYRTLLSTIEIGATVWVLGHGAGGAWHALLYLAWVGLTVVFAWRYWRRVDVCTAARLALTHTLAENMVGHRTRLAQQAPESWHTGEDEQLDRYIHASVTTDRIAALLHNSSVAWRVLGMAALAGAFIDAEASIPELAIGLGGLLLGARALTSFCSGINSLAVASIAWRRIASINDAAAKQENLGAMLPRQTLTTDEGAALLSLHDVSFSYPGRGCTAVDSATLEIRHGDRLLLLGPSGGGKSTLVALLAALRQPDAGLILCRGLDLQTLGDQEWRQQVAAAPQFHDNHVLTETFAFNLLMGRRWPPTSEDLEEAESLCRELGLGELIDRMPSGLMQIVGDTGWQLSHGEKSRLFVARTLLQDANLVVLDESFGALDPVNLKRAIGCARQRASTLAVVAHP